MDKVKDLIVATWNVRTLLVPGKLQEIADKLCQRRPQDTESQRLEIHCDGQKCLEAVGVGGQGPQRAVKPVGSVRFEIHSR
jgi:hypothetical protein